MTAPMRDDAGEMYYPETPEDATLFHVESGAMPIDPSSWPWPGVAGVAKVEIPCTTPEVCFPNGIDPKWAAATCVHGSFQLA